jgi:hypothetical protein
MWIALAVGVKLADVKLVAAAPLLTWIVTAEIAMAV